MKVDHHDEGFSMHMTSEESVIYFGDVDGQLTVGALTPERSDGQLLIEAALMGCAFMLANDEEFVEQMAKIHEQLLVAGGIDDEVSRH